MLRNWCSIASAKLAPISELGEKVSNDPIAQTLGTTDVETRAVQLPRRPPWLVFVKSKGYTIRCNIPPAVSNFQYRASAMKRSRKISVLMIMVAAVACSLVGSQQAEAGNGWLFRRHRSVQQRTYVQPRKVVAPAVVGSTKATSPAVVTNAAPAVRIYRPSQPVTRYQSGSRQPFGGNNWPGAIGHQSPRYQFFQDVNGYWR
ncbi:hypothetical protein LOC67_08840 [Stieleria sp. JC731]|uniref:hypothetical protein n=2 Tax=Pirellulaceae TaxID=2691357 RepID=UPI001E5F93D2|nr:hypothetical protein [Stieleria sp. JC731]MCC9600667.1 hypothetical protein [Stieleria sp. JC731]